MKLELRSSKVEQKEKKRTRAENEKRKTHKGDDRDGLPLFVVLQRDLRGGKDEKTIP